MGLLFWSGSLLRNHSTHDSPLLAHAFSSFFSSSRLDQSVKHSLSNRERGPFTSFLRLYSTSNGSSSSTSGVSVVDVIEQAMKDLIEIDDDDQQAMVSVTNILADVLQLPWTTGYKDLTWIAQKHKRQAIPQPFQELACRVLTEQEALEFANKLHRRKQQEPIQYILGKWDFLDSTFRVRAPLLCPRPETEELVELVAQEISGHKHHQRILDVGCGTGCIGISLAAKFRHLQVSAIDVEPIAVETSLENARHILGSQWKDQYDAQLCSAQDLVIENRRFDMVVSNPPYIPSGDMNDLDKEVKDYESHQALSGLSGDGLDVIRDIIKQLPFWCHVSATCWMEVDPSQPDLLRELLASHPHVAFVSSHHDMFGKERFVKLQVHCVGEEP